jgi:integral membrane sensor domain MASE1
MNESPVFRKAIQPWYDTTAVCTLLCLLMAGVFLFGLKGVLIAVKNEAYQPYLWLPLLLIVLSALVFISIGIRLFRRRSGRS